MFSLLEKQEYSINYKWKEYKFESPKIYDFLIAQKHLEEDWFVWAKNALRIFLPKLKLNDLEYLEDWPKILEDVYSKIFFRKSNWNGWEEWFFPSVIDYLCPDVSRQVEYMKNYTIWQMLTQSAAKERNNNLAADKKYKNKEILLEELGTEYVEAAKDRIRNKFNTKKPSNE